MAEKVLALPLNGEEIIEAVLAKARDLMRKDCFLTTTTAYDYFSASIDVHINMHDCGRHPNVSTHVNVTEGERPAVGVTSAKASLVVDAVPPNQARLESDQPIPVLTTTPDGRQEIKPVRYAKSATRESRTQQ